MKRVGEERLGGGGGGDAAVRKSFYLVYLIYLRVRSLRVPPRTVPNAGRDMRK